MARFRICKRFTVESGHMLSKHPERCRYPHGHTRTVEVVVSGDQLNDQDMLVDFKALKHAIQPSIVRFDHAMAVNQEDPLLNSIAAVYPESLVIFDQDPTTEVLARHLYETIQAILDAGHQDETYPLDPGLLRCERVRVWETPDSWAEYGTGDIS